MTETKQAAPYWSWFSSLRSFLEWPRASSPSRRAGKGGTTVSSAGETKASGRFVASGFLKLSGLALLTAGLLSGKAPEAPRRMDELFAHRWQWMDNAPCPGEGFRELSSEERSVEVFLLGDGRALASSLPLPESFTCAPIPAPSFIEEI